MIFHINIQHHFIEDTTTPTDDLKRIKSSFSWDIYTSFIVFQYIAYSNHNYLWSLRERLRYFSVVNALEHCLQCCLIPIFWPKPDLKPIIHNILEFDLLVAVWNTFMRLVAALSFIWEVLLFLRLLPIIFIVIKTDFHVFIVKKITISIIKV